jgi:hypothetical protein
MLGPGPRREKLGRASADEKLKNMSKSFSAAAKCKWTASEGRSTRGELQFKNKAKD